MGKTLYIIDGYAQIFRAYYAIRTPMQSPNTGEPTNAVFGFTGMLLKLLAQHSPDYVIVAVDAPGRTFRDDLYRQYLELHPAHAATFAAQEEAKQQAIAQGQAAPQTETPQLEAPQPETPTPAEVGTGEPAPVPRYESYKGTRQATPDALSAQIERIFEVIDTLGIPIIGKRGLEADDVIATLVQQTLDDPAYKDVDIRIISRDKDLEQLLGERVALFDVHTNVTLDAPGLQASKGITPAQVVDVMALTGDTVDNVPGVEGIGLKTAAQLIQQWGDVESLMANLDQIKGKRREMLERARPFLPISKQMVTLKRDAELPFPLADVLRDAQMRPPDLQTVLPLFQELGFNRYQEEARRLAAPRAPTPVETKTDAPKNTRKQKQAASKATDENEAEGG